MASGRLHKGSCARLYFLSICYIITLLNQINTRNEHFSPSGENLETAACEEPQMFAIPLSRRLLLGAALIVILWLLAAWAL